jgi:hypothetical protein
MTWISAPGRNDRMKGSLSVVSSRSDLEELIGADRFTRKAKQVGLARLIWRRNGDFSLFLLFFPLYRRDLF